MKTKVTHDFLVTKATNWLKRKHSLVITEMWSYFEIADAIGLNQNGLSTLIECKTSRSDYYNDKNKFFRRFPQNGMGDYRYYLCPEGLILEKSLPKYWGLLYLKGSRIFLIKEAEKQLKAEAKEYSLMISLIRRIGKDLPVKGVNVKFYSYGEADERTKATAGICLND